MKKLIIVESPSKATTIQKYVGDEYIIEATRGHMVELGKGGTNGIGIDVDKDFKPYYVMMKDKIQLFDKLIQATEKCSEIMIASDPDREGEAIAYHIQARLESCGKPISRVEFGEITKSGVQQGIKDKHPININLFRSQEARRILDRIVGFMVSPFLMNFYGANLSAGRVQSVAVRMIVDREKEIENFIPEEYWNLQANFTNGTTAFTAKFNKKISNKDEADQIINLLKEKKDFTVTSVKSIKKNEHPLPPLTTASLQRFMAKKHSFEPERTMRVAQNLYENGYVTYIRTDSTRIADEAIVSVREWIKENGFVVPKQIKKYTVKKSAQDAHECIRPTNINNSPENSILTGDDKDVYKAIWQHFVACQMMPAVWGTTNIVISDDSGKLIFSISGRTLENKGFLEIFGVDSEKADLPKIEKDAVVSIIYDTIKSQQKFTQPVARYNNDSILKELEDRQIGRPSTYAELIKKISSRNYVEKKGNTYYPTDLGKKITDVLVKFFPFMEYEYSADMEKKLDEIALGNLNHINMLKEFFTPFKIRLTQAYVNNGSDVCEKCGSPMIIRTNSKDQSKFIACSNYPKCYNTKTINN